jgi:hypothetical protein
LTLIGLAALGPGLAPACALPSALFAEGGWPGVARRQLTFLLLRQKQSKQKKRRPWFLRPFASLRAACGARSSRGQKQLASLKQVFALIRLDLRSSAHPQGVGTGRSNSQQPNTKLNT